MPTTGASTYDEFVFTTGDELWDRIGQAHRRFAGLLSVTPSRTALANSEWTAGDVAGHLLTVVRRYTRRDLGSAAGLSQDAAGIADLNETELRSLKELSVADILDQVWQELADLEELLPRTTDLHHTFPFHAGQEVDAAGWLGNLIGEFLVHGRDVAKARGKLWKIGSRNAALALNMGIQAIPAFVSPGVSGDLKLEIRTPETNPWVLDLACGELSSRRARHREPVDVRVFARAEPLLLNRYGRIGMPRVTALGATVIGGRRPWRLARMPSSFQTP